MLLNRQFYLRTWKLYCCMNIHHSIFAASLGRDLQKLKGERERERMTDN